MAVAIGQRLGGATSKRGGRPGARRWSILAFVVSLLVGVLAPSSAFAATSGSSGSGGAQGVSAHSITIGVLSVQTGPLGTEGTTNLKAFKAVVDWQNAHGGVYGRKISLDVVDDATNPNLPIPNVRKLVEADHVFALVQLDPLAVVIAPYVKSIDIPVITALSGYWGPNYLPNVFGAYGNATGKIPVTTTIPLIMKKLGATDVGSFAVSIAQSSVVAAQDNNLGAKAIGLKANYLNTSVPIGQPNFSPQALALKKAGVDGIYSAMDQTTNANLMQGIVQNSVGAKVVVLASGYNPQSAQGVNDTYFQNIVTTTAELPGQLTSNPRVKQAIKILQKYGGPTTVPPMLDADEGYNVGSLLVEALKVAGPHPTDAGLIHNLHNVTDWLGGLNIKPMNFKNPGPYESINSGGQGLCAYGMKLVGHKFVDVTGLVCGKVVK